MNTIDQKLQSAIDKIHSAQSTAEKNVAITEYNTLIESLESVSVDDQFATLEQSVEFTHPSIKGNSLSEKEQNTFLALCNTLRGIRNNAAKGKYSTKLTESIIIELSETIDSIKTIDLDSAISQRNERKEKYTSIRDKIDKVGI